MKQTSLLAISAAIAGLFPVVVSVTRRCSAWYRCPMEFLGRTVVHDLLGVVVPVCHPDLREIEQVDELVLTAAIGKPAIRWPINGTIFDHRRRQGRRRTETFYRRQSTLHFITAAEPVAAWSDQVLA